MSATTPLVSSQMTGESRFAASRHLDLGRPLESAAVRVEEGHLEDTRLARPECEAEGWILTDGGRGVELRDGLARIAHNDPIDEAVVPVDGLALLPLDTLVGMDEERASARDGAARDGARHPDPDLAQRAHIAHPATTTRTLRLTIRSAPSCSSATARTSPVSARRRLVETYAWPEPGVRLNFALRGRGFLSERM